MSLEYQRIFDLLYPIGTIYSCDGVIPAYFTQLGTWNFIGTTEVGEYIIQNYKRVH